MLQKKKCMEYGGKYPDSWQLLKLSDEYTRVSYTIFLTFVCLKMFIIKHYKITKVIKGRSHIFLWAECIIWFSWYFPLFSLPYQYNNDKLTGNIDRKREWEENCWAIRNYLTTLFCSAWHHCLHELKYQSGKPHRRVTNEYLIPPWFSSFPSG